jgi:hypothetical protein
MDESTAAFPDRDNVAPRRVQSWLVLTLLIAAGCGLRLWVIAHTEVAARDSIGFIRYALRLERDPLLNVLREGEQAPGYPAVVLLVSWPVRAWRGDSSCDTMVLSCQLASALMAVLSIIPTVFLGRELGGRRVGWLAAAVVLCLPAWLRLTSDGLSEGTYLFWLAMAMWIGVRALRRPTSAGFLSCGLATGMAYLTRPEGLEVVVAIAAVLLGTQFLPRLRQPWSRAALQFAALACGLLVCLGPYATIIGGLSNKNTTKALIGAPNVNPDGLLPQYGGGGRTLLASWFHQSGGLGSRWAWATEALANETARAFEYAGLGFVIIGLAVFRPRPETGAGRVMMAVIVSIHALILCRMAMISGYLSERHTLLFLFAGSFPAAAALVWLGGRLSRVPAGALTAGMAIAGLAIAMPALTKPLHSNRAGHKAAGKWLAAHVKAGDAIMDPFCWAEFYAGRLEPRVTTDRPDRVFVILETNENQHSRLPHVPAAKAIAGIGQIVYHWPENRPVGNAQLVVYETARDRLPVPEALNSPPEYRVGVKSASRSALAQPVARDG